MEPKQQLSDLQNTLHKATSKVVPFFRNNKKLSFIMLSAIIVIIALYIVGAYLMDPQDKVAAFEQAVRSGDVKTLKSLLTSEESNLTIDDKHLQDIITYSKENADYLPKQINGMMSQINDEEQGIPSVNAGGTNDFYLKKTSIPLFYSYYSINIRPYFLDISTNESGAILKLDGKEVYKTTEDEKQHTVGPIMPGIYKTSAEKKYQFALLSQDSTVSAFDEETATAKSDLQLYGGDLKLEGNFEDTAIFVNGKAIGKTLKEMPEIGPISFNGTIRIHGERQFPWGLEKSPDALVEQNTSSVDITPVPFANQETRQPIVDLINKFAKEDLQALIKHNPNLLTTIDDNLKAAYIESINDDVQFNRTWKGKVLGTRIDFDNITLSQDETTKIYKATVPVEIHAKSREYNAFTADDPLEDKAELYTITLSYDEKNKKWLVSEQKDEYFNTNKYMNGKNVVKSEFK